MLTKPYSFSSQEHIELQLPSEDMSRPNELQSGFVIINYESELYAFLPKTKSQIIIKLDFFTQKDYLNNSII